ncbi:host attachment family protein [Sulfitobacter sp. D35]|uniref:host attachment family protein n=1 Tax=Sulfitobacter sp. D35 TaxID=3083252 RepID=UPI00296FC736|nr:host attachment family protein [Sulfitobacter sp. D35]MDW4499837.1 host attachment family protein [Sulfitobacter sp. D35]
MAEPKNETWILVADGEKALFLRNEGDADYPNFQVERQEEQENPSTGEQGAHPPGRMHDGGPGQKSALSDTDWHALEKERFAHDLADMLYKMAHKGRFDRIVLVASSTVLGELRDKLHQEVTERVVGEIDKVLTNHPLDEIEKLVQKELQSAA